MTKVAVTYSPEVGGSSVVSIKKSFSSEPIGAEVVDADFRLLMSDISKANFEQLYQTAEGRQTLFAHAKAKAAAFLEDIDCLALSGNSAMIDPILFNQQRRPGENYDFSRTVAELALLHVALNKGMPIIGVCGGHQVMAVHGGGKIRNLDVAQLEKQHVMEYEPLSFYADSMIGQIVKQGYTDEEFSQVEFFGGHYQVVAEPVDGYDVAAIASDGESIEALESRFGAPVIGTQFHPEVNLNGLPGTEFVYRRTKQDEQAGLNLFLFMNNAAKAYRAKQALNKEFHQHQHKVKEGKYLQPSALKSKDKASSKPKVQPESSTQQVTPTSYKGALALGLIGTLTLTGGLLALTPLAPALALGAASSAIAAAASITGIACLSISSYQILKDSHFAEQIAESWPVRSIAGIWRAWLSFGYTEYQVVKLRQDQDNAEQQTATEVEVKPEPASQQDDSRPWNQNPQSPYHMLLNTPACLFHQSQHLASSQQPAKEAQSQPDSTHPTF